MLLKGVNPIHTDAQTSWTAGHGGMFHDGLSGAGKYVNFVYLSGTGISDMDISIVVCSETCHAIEQLRFGNPRHALELGRP
ncbi:hypothetical protein ISF_03825 [Cordyceps fumosorosea ARSEF 2679]|uniref:Uncharacterized protein n=1 Tax=Cordyceps fumosorosea (strain ARSEF 2679) TaxID=1081104 RepID=A0A167ZL99_CORFA|nr:hypothetical protein ISF_03825 [Cordyceps fumosorosea ARSEF 2679]OAA67649.1 hypothetical protein ISF_03825 [Cordyceps fumosorosea ARSEF 2679]